MGDRRHLSECQRESLSIRGTLLLFTCVSHTYATLILIYSSYVVGLYWLASNIRPYKMEKKKQQHNCKNWPDITTITSCK